MGLFSVLHKAWRMWLEHNYGFKAIFNQLLSLRTYHECITPWSARNLESNSYDTELGGGTGRRTTRFAVMAHLDDLIEMMSFFKSSPNRTPRADDKAVLCLSTKKIHQWIGEWLDDFKRISFEFKRSIGWLTPQNISPVLLVFERLLDLNKKLHTFFEDHKSAMRISSALSCAIAEVLVEHLQILLPGQKNMEYCGQDYTFHSDPDEDRRRKLNFEATQRADQMELALLLLDTLRLLISHVIPLSEALTDGCMHQENEEPSVDVHSKIIQRKWARSITALLKSVSQLPVLPLPCRRVMKPGYVHNVSKKCEIYTTMELETWAFEMMQTTLPENSSAEINNELSNTDQSVDSVQSRSGKSDQPCFCDLFYQSMSDLSSVVSCIFFELIIFVAGFICTPLPTKYQWIEDLFECLFKSHTPSEASILNRLASHACGQFCSLVSNQKSALPVCCKEIVIGTIVRALFVIEWLTRHYPSSLNSLKQGSSADLLCCFRPRRIQQLIDKLGEQTTNVVQLKLTKYVLVALSSRIYSRLTDNTKHDWIELDNENAGGLQVVQI
ncbi:unnamed protein product [Calicophoron daubneyi]|uniref:Uncharacterized protein n=1 Tax=Calicophoron daubneyi TaxID=300641 RepID=A0AAV2TBZ9_CALDB